MAERVFLHIGAPKSGTTYIQSILWENRALLREAGIAVPGRRRVDYNLATAAARTNRLGNGRPARTLRRLASQARAWSGTAALSAEWFCATPQDLIARLVGMFDDAEVHVVYTARALVPLVTAAWQETLKTAHRESLPEFVAALDDDERKWSWWSIDPAVVLERWAAVVPLGRVHVVTVPPSGADPGELLRRFAEVVGFDPAPLDTSAAQANESLSVEAAELVRRVAPRVDEIVGFSNLPWPERYRWLRRYFAHQLMVPRRGHRIALDEADRERVAARAERSVANLRSAGYPVVGGLDDLATPPVRPGALRPEQVSDSAMLDLSVPVMAELVAQVRELTLRLEAVEKAASPAHEELP
jgi:hypothetical protein